MNQFTQKISAVLAVVAMALIVNGCSAGMAPEGPEGKELQAKFDSLPLEKRISLIEHGPGTPEQKANQIEQLKRNAGKS